MAIPEIILGGFFSNGAIDRLLELVNGTMDRLVHSALVMRHDDRLEAITARLDHAAFVVMAGLVTDGVAEVHIDPPDAVAIPFERGTEHGLHVIGNPLATIDVSVCSDLDQHSPTPLFGRVAV